MSDKKGKATTLITKILMNLPLLILLLAGIVGGTITLHFNTLTIIICVIVFSIMYAIIIARE